MFPCRSYRPGFLHALHAPGIARATPRARRPDHIRCPAITGNHEVPMSTDFPFTRFPDDDPSGDSATRPGPSPPLPLAVDEPFHDVDHGPLKAGKEAQVNLVERFAVERSADEPVGDDDRSCLIARKQYVPGRSPRRANSRRWVCSARPCSATTSSTARVASSEIPATAEPSSECPPTANSPPGSLDRPRIRRAVRAVDTPA